MAFEPNPTAYNIAVKNCQSNKSIFIQNIALSSQVGDTAFHVTENLVSSSINKIVADFGGINDYKNQLSVKNVITVPTKPLDEIDTGASVLFIKIDTQGHEIEVLKGATKTLQKTSFILVEMSNHDVYIGGCKYYDIDALLRQSHFKLADIIVTSRKAGLLVTEYDAVYFNTSLIKL